jgi:hypothetical protein
MGDSQLLCEAAFDAVRHTCARGTTNHQAELNTLLDILLSANLDLRRSNVSIGTVYVDMRDQTPAWYYQATLWLENPKGFDEQRRKDSTYCAQWRRHDGD